MIIVSMFASCIYAEDPSFYYKRGENIDIKVPCLNSNHSSCSPVALCNVTINWPNTTVMISNKAMTNNIVYHNYTVGVLNVLGVYPTTIICSDLGDSGYSLFNFEVTDNGQKGNDYTFILAIGLISFLIVLIGIAVNSNEHSFLKITCFLFALIFAFLIPASFTTFDVKNTFYFAFMGFLTVFSIYLGIIGIHKLLLNMGVVRGNKHED